MKALAIVINEASCILPKLLFFLVEPDSNLLLLSLSAQLIDIKTFLYVCLSGIILLVLVNLFIANKIFYCCYSKTSEFWCLDDLSVIRRWSLTVVWLQERSLEMPMPERASPTSFSCRESLYSLMFLLYSVHDSLYLICIMSFTWLTLVWVNSHVNDWLAHTWVRLGGWFSWWLLCTWGPA